jgi:RNA polymerase sigma-70 factor, ECF subfamily
LTSSTQKVTQFLVDWGNGDQTALNKIIPLVQDELRRLASSYLRRERPDHTLQTTALINEAYLRLIDQRDVKWENRAHFFGIAAQLMRRILIDHARHHYYAKRGGKAQQVPFDETTLISKEKSIELVALDEALDRLAAYDPRKARIVELRYFGGLNLEETAEVLGISSPTVQREWRASKVWLYRMLAEGGNAES